MEKQIFDVLIFDVETKNGKNAIEKWNIMSNQETTIIKQCNSLEEALSIYDKIPSNIQLLSNGCEKYYLHNGKAIAVNIYNEDNDWINGGDWVKYELPNLD